MRLGARLSLVFGVAGLVVVSTVSGLAWWLAAREVRSAIDADLLERSVLVSQISNQQIGLRAGAQAVVAVPAPESPFARLEEPDRGIRFYSAEGAGVTPGEIEIAPSVAGQLVIGGDPLIVSVTTTDAQYRVAYTAIQPVVVGQTEIAFISLFREVSEEESTVAGLGTALIAGSIVVTALVAFGGWYLGERLGRGVHEVAEAAERLATLDDTPDRIPVTGSDETAQLATSFNRLLTALEVAREQQQRLVADASHELRTPLTSLRMRIEFLASNADLSADVRQEALEAAVAETEELSSLVAELVDLAADIRADEEEPSLLSLADLISEVAERKRLTSGRMIVEDVAGTEVLVRPNMVSRALHNLVDNAIKYSPPDSEVVITERHGQIEVLDRGPGIAAEDASLVFDRFYRSPRARTRPGHGIGLAIVKQVAESHHGAVWATRRPDGGAAVGFSVVDETSGTLQASLTSS